MARQLQLRRGTTSESRSFIGALGELTVDTSTNQLRLHDGMTPGGHIVGDHTVVVNTANLFDWKWSDHLLPDDQDAWVLADANEWISADDYPDAYQHLLDDKQNAIEAATVATAYYWTGQMVSYTSSWWWFYTLSQTPAVGDTVYLVQQVDGSGPYYTRLIPYPFSTISRIDSETGYIYVGSGSSEIRIYNPQERQNVVLMDHKPQVGGSAGYATYDLIASDGHKIIYTGFEGVDYAYQSNGVAWYYQIDTENRRFKLPRTKYGATGLRDQVGGYVKPGLPDHTHNLTSRLFRCEYRDIGNNCTYEFGSSTSQEDVGVTQGVSTNSIYGNSNTVQPPATQMYLYFCLKPAGEEIDPSGDTTVCEAIKNQNDDPESEPILYNWEGTLEEYLNQDIEHEHPEWICYITDDVLDATSNPAYYVHRVGDEIIQGYKTFINTIYAEGGVEGTASSAKWADLAERYQTDAQYPIGTLVKFGGEYDITVADSECHAVISEKPGYLLDSSLENSLPIALSGKTPVRVLGKVKKFDKLVLSDEPGVAKVQETGSERVIGIALESSLIEEEKLVLSVVKLTF